MAKTTKKARTKRVIPANLQIAKPAKAGLCCAACRSRLSELETRIEGTERSFSDLLGRVEELESKHQGPPMSNVGGPDEKAEEGVPHDMGRR